MTIRKMNAELMETTVYLYRTRIVQNGKLYKFAKMKHKANGEGNVVRYNDGILFGWRINRPSNRSRREAETFCLIYTFTTYSMASLHINGGVGGGRRLVAPEQVPGVNYS